MTRKAWDGFSTALRYITLILICVFIFSTSYAAANSSPDIGSVAENVSYSYQHNLSWVITVSCYVLGLILIIISIYLWVNSCRQSKRFPKKIIGLLLLVFILLFAPALFTVKSGCLGFYLPPSISSSPTTNVE
jgi:glucan phosphoethanolaminetransferase (alkaline phosphatase superfamily)